MTNQENEKLPYPSPFAETLGIVLESCQQGSSRCQLAIKDQLRNVHGNIHGGVVYSISDISMGVALFTLLERDELCATIEIKIAYLKPASANSITAAAKVIQRGKNIAFVEAEVFNEDKLIAKSLGTFSIFKKD